MWRLLKKHGANCIVIDADGIGRVAVQLLELSTPTTVTIIPFEGSSRDVDDPQTFWNRRHEAHWKMREMFEKNRISISVDPVQREELASIKMVEHNKGFIAIEKKKELKKRLNRSPDKADTIMMMCGTFDEIPVLTKLQSRYPTRDAMASDYPFNHMTC